MKSYLKNNVIFTKYLDPSPSRSFQRYINQSKQRGKFCNINIKEIEQIISYNCYKFNDFHNLVNINQHWS